MDNRPIGLFDSGLGGLTAVKEVMRVLPQENLLYFGDTGRVPYGTRGVETIRKYAGQDARFLLQFDIKLLIIACGTVTSVAYDEVAAMCPVPVLGVLESAVQAAAKATKNGKVGIIATNATIRSASYQKLLGQIAPEIQTLGKACPLFVPMVENGRFHKDDPVIRLLAEEYLQEINAFGADTLILGCTHYPLLKDLLSELTDAVLIDPGAMTALAAARLLKAEDKLAAAAGGNIAAGGNTAAGGNAAESGRRQFFVSDDTASFQSLAELFLGEAITQEVQKIDIENQTIEGIPQEIRRGSASKQKE